MFIRDPAFRVGENYVTGGVAGEERQPRAPRVEGNFLEFKYKNGVFHCILRCSFYKFVFWTILYLLTVNCTFLRYDCTFVNFNRKSISSSVDSDPFEGGRSRMPPKDAPGRHCRKGPSVLIMTDPHKDKFL